MRGNSGFYGGGLGYAIVSRLLAREKAAPAHTPQHHPVILAPRMPYQAAEVVPLPEQAVFTPAITHVAAQDRVAPFIERFCYWTGDYARQFKGVDRDTGEVYYGWARTGKTNPDNCQLTPSLIEQHLRGKLTLGTYLVAPDNTCKLLVLDHDDKRILPEGDPATGHKVIPEDGLVMLQDCRRRLEEQGIDCAVAESRRGGHLFVFLDEPVTVRDAQALAMLALGADEAARMARGEQAFEVYPSRERTGTNFPQNIALPLGVHLKDGERHPFIGRYGDAVAHTLSGQLDYAQSVRLCPVREVLRERPWLYRELDAALHPARPRDVAPERIPERAGVAQDREPQRRRVVSGPGRGVGLIAQWKEATDCREVVARLTAQRLTDHGDYASGHCPFHDDQQASLLVFRDGWRCLAEARGGDALNFIGEYENMTPKEALAYAREQFPVPGLGIAPRGRG